MSARMANCPQCGKGFCVMSPRDWAYRVGAIYYCSWKCIREHDAKIPPHPIDAGPEPGVPEVLPEDVIERVREGVAHECEMEVASAPVRPASELRHEAEIADVYERARNRGKTPRAVMAKAVREYMTLTRDQGMSAKQAADKIGVPKTTIFRWFSIMKGELGLEAISRKDAGKRMAVLAKAKKIAAGQLPPPEEEDQPEPPEPDEHSEPAEVNRSGEKLARLNATRARIRALLADGEEAVV